MKLEELLNTLIKRGWKPFWRETRHELSSWVVYDTIDIKWKWDIRVIDRRHHHIRELVSKESGLRQFVCNNWMIPEDRKCHERVLDLTFWPNWPDVSAQMCSRNYEYWLMSSAICDEKYLEQFLIENIKVWNED